MVLLSGPPPAGWPSRQDSGSLQLTSPPHTRNNTSSMRPTLLVEYFKTTLRSGICRYPPSSATFGFLSEPPPAAPRPRPRPCPACAHVLDVPPGAALRAFCSTSLRSRGLTRSFRRTGCTPTCAPPRSRARTRHPTPNAPLDALRLRRAVACRVVVLAHARGALLFAWYLLMGLLLAGVVFMPTL
jgi:hypothetical protein